MTYQALSVSDSIASEPTTQHVSFTDEEEARRYSEMMGFDSVMSEDSFDDFDAQGLGDLRK